MKNLPDYRVLSITDSTMTNNNEKVTVFGCSQVIYESWIAGANNRYSFDLSPSINFVLHPDSSLARLMEKAGPNEDIVSINLEFFELRKKEVNGVIQDFYYHKEVQLLTPFISKDLNKKLEKAYENFIERPEDSVVIGYLTNLEKKIDVYLITKEPNTDTYYGILKNIIKPRGITNISLKHLKSLELKEQKINPFHAIDFLETDTKWLFNKNSNDIRPAYGINNLKFGLKYGEIKKLFGEPDSSNQEWITDFKSIMYWEYPKLGLKLKFSSNFHFLLESIILTNKVYKFLGNNFIGMQEDYLLANSFKLGIPDLKLNKTTKNGKKFYSSISKKFVFEIYDDKIQLMHLFPKYDNDGIYPLWPNKRNFNEWIYKSSN